MKRIFAIVLVLALALAALAACSPEGPGVDGEVGMVRPGEDSSSQDYPNYQYGDIIENDSYPRRRSNPRIFRWTETPPPILLCAGR